MLESVGNHSLRLVGADPANDQSVQLSSARQADPGGSAQIHGTAPSPEVLSLLDTLKGHLKDGTKNSFDTGDLVTKLVDSHGLTVAWLAQKLEYSRTRLHELYLTAKATAPEDRDASICFSFYEIARKAADKFQMDPKACLQEVKSLGKASVRQVSRAFAQKQIERLNAESRAKGVLTTGKNAKLMDQCHFGSCINVLKAHPDAKFDMLWADPPYVYDSAYGGSAVSREECDNIGPKAAIQITVDVLATCGAHLKPDAPLLLCQAAGELQKEFLDAIERYGWEIVIQLIWDKKRTAPGDNSGPYLPRTESIWVLKRKGERLGRCDDKIHSDILEGFAPVQHRSTDAGMTHMFQKPVELCEFFVKKHTRPGQVIGDLFGCSGSMCIAAAMHDRHWVYIESQQDNYRWGSARIADALAQQRRNAA